MAGNPDSKPHYTDFKLPESGTVVLVQSTLEPSDEDGIAQASGAVDRARANWEEGLALISGTARA